MQINQNDPESIRWLRANSTHASVLKSECSKTGLDSSDPMVQRVVASARQEGTPEGEIRQFLKRLGMMGSCQPMVCHLILKNLATDATAAYSARAAKTVAGGDPGVLRQETSTSLEFWHTVLDCLARCQSRGAAHSQLETHALSAIAELEAL